MVMRRITRNLVLLAAGTRFSILVYWTCNMANMIEYFAVKMSPTSINGSLDSLFHRASKEEGLMYRTLKASTRVQPAFHVTLIHRTKAEEHAEYWAKLSDMHPTPCQCKVYLERLVWDDRVMAFVVILRPSTEGAEEWRSVNAMAHITVGTASRAVKPFESNNLLATWARDGSGANGIREMAVDVELAGVVEGVPRWS